MFRRCLLLEFHLTFSGNLILMYSVITVPTNELKGFHKVESKQWEFKHEFFQEGRADMLKNISRRRSKKRDERDFDEPPTVPNKVK